MKPSFNPDGRPVGIRSECRFSISSKNEYRCRREQSLADVRGYIAVGVKFAHFAIPPYQFFVTRTPNRRGSVRNTLVVRPLSSLFRKVPVMAVTSNTFLTYPMTCQPA